MKLCDLNSGFSHLFLARFLQNDFDDKYRKKHDINRLLPENTFGDTGPMYILYEVLK